mmetsp:Transcript_56819/g.126883  ORF Transcript_56819/g.126883 Transcript_56819/m.126883 type:complete len:228 (-) Transcript_56819:209-892(-)
MTSRHPLVNGSSGSDDDAAASAAGPRFAAGEPPASSSLRLLFDGPPRPLPPSSFGKIFSMHLRYEKSTSVPSFRTSTKHFVSGNSGLKPTLTLWMPGPVFSAGLAWCASRSVTNFCASSESAPPSTALPSAMRERAYATTSSRVVYVTPPSVCCQRLVARRTLSCSSETSTSVDGFRARAMALRSSDGTSAFMRLKLAIVARSTHCSLDLALSAWRNLSILKLASQK